MVGSFIISFNKSMAGLTSQVIFLRLFPLGGGEGSPKATPTSVNFTCMVRPTSRHDNFGLTQHSHFTAMHVGFATMTVYVVAPVRCGAFSTQLTLL